MGASARQPGQRGPWVPLLLLGLSACATRVPAGAAVPRPAKPGQDGGAPATSHRATAPSAPGSLPRGEEDAGAPPSGQRPRIAAAAHRALTPTKEFARATGKDAAVRAAEVLSALAEALEAATPQPARASEARVEVQFQAKRLRRSEALSPGLARWIKEGLTASLDGLEASVRSNETSRFWIGLARGALHEIDPRSALVFQRPVVQDALRATVDAFLAIGQGPAAGP